MQLFFRGVPRRDLQIICVIRLTTRSVCRCMLFMYVPRRPCCFSSLLWLLCDCVIRGIELFDDTCDKFGIDESVVLEYRTLEIVLSRYMDVCINVSRGWIRGRIVTYNVLNIEEDDVTYSRYKPRYGDHRKQMFRMNRGWSLLCFHLACSDDVSVDM